MASGPSDQAVAATSGAAGGVVCELSELQLLEAELEVDAMQLLHVTHNRADCLAMVVTDDTTSQASQAGHVVLELRHSADRLQEQLVSERASVSQAHRMRLANTREAISAQIGSTFRETHWLRRLGALLNGAPPALVEVLRDRLRADASLNSGSLATACSVSAASVVLKAAEERAHCLECRTQLLASLDEMASKPTRREVIENSNCKRCRSDWGKKGAECAHCAREDVYDAYFYQLYTHRRQRKVELAKVSGGIADTAADDPGAGAMRGNVGEAFLEDSALLRLLGALGAWLASQAAVSGGVWEALAAEASREVEVLGLLKREIRACRALWSSHFDLLSQLDELTQGVSTMELVESEEALRKINPLEAERHKYVVRYEHAERTQKYEADLVLARSDLSLYKRQYSYLRQQALLADAEGDVADADADGGGGGKMACPVCQEELGRERAVPKCAHSLCTPCAEQIMRRHGGKFVCPLCREEGPAAMASELRWADGSSAGSCVKGSWGTKVTAIVEQVWRAHAHMLVCMCTDTPHRAHALSCLTK